MPSCFCTKRKSKKNQSITLDDLITYVCGITYHMLMADVYGWCNNFVEHCGWEFQYQTEFTKERGYTMVLIIEVKYPLNDLTSEGENKYDCVVCTHSTNDLIVCCNQPVCKKCLKNIKKHNPDNLCCPMCRANLDTYTTKFTLTKDEVRERYAR